jgi:hypothetical protein
MTQSRSELIEKYSKIFESGEFKESPKGEFDSFMFPVAMKIASQTISQDLISVNPIGTQAVGEELDRIKNEVKSINREGKIDSVVDDKEFEEMKVEDHPDFRSSIPRGNLFYMDFQYGTSSKV